MRTSTADNSAQGSSSADERWMLRAIELAERATGCTSPNPPVGSVIVADDRIVGEGWHRGVGQAHAEADALRDAGSQARGATAYVTLEPCNHTGRTPPCTAALIDAGIARVVYAVTDPNPIASGGAHRLAAAGIDVVSGVAESAARRLARFFLHHVETQRPWIIAKSASSLDGRIATRTGHSQWITGDDARRAGHRLRQATDAILVGIETVLADNPALTVRLPEGDCRAGDVRHPTPIVLDTQARLPLDAQLLTANPHKRPIVVVSEAVPATRLDALRGAGADVIALPPSGPASRPASRPASGSGSAGDARPDPRLLIEELGRRGLQSLLLEGGPRVHGSFMDAGLVDEVVAFIAPMIIGGSAAPAAFSGLGADTLEHAARLDSVIATPVGADLMIQGFVQRPSATVLQPRLGLSSQDASKTTGTKTEAA